MTLTNVGGNLALGGTLNVQTSAGGSFDPGVYRVINYAGTRSGTLALGTVPRRATISSRPRWTSRSIWSTPMA